jgi:pimeloyl-ACP methyl ester carboxylesterase
MHPMIVRTILENLVQHHFMNRNLTKLGTWGALLICLLASAQVWGQTPKSRLAKRITPQQVHFFEYLPQGYSAANAAKKYPTIIYLHDSDARGVNGANMDMVLNQGPLLHVNTNAHNLEFVVNGATEQFMVFAPHLTTHAPNFNDIYEDFFRHISNNYHIDTDRIYLTGYNMGAASALVMAANRPDRYAALAPVATNAWPAAGAACSISGANIPLWALHGSIANSGTASSAASQAWVTQANTQCSPAPAVPARLTVFDNTDNATTWGRAYLPNNSIPQLTPRNLYQWFLQYRKSDNLNLLGNTPPAISAPAEVRRFLPFSSLELDASASTDPDGQIVYWNWRFLSGSWVPMSNVNTSKLILTGVNREVINTYEVTAVDNRGGVSMAQVRVVVRNPPPPGCERANHLIAPPGGVFNGRQMGVQPGDTIWVGAGRHNFMDLVDVVGAPGRPVVVINCGGQAIVGRANPSYGIKLVNCRYIKFTGSGSATHQYGIWVNRAFASNAPTFGFSIGGTSTDIEVERIHISQVSEHGFTVKSDPKCNTPEVWRENFVMRNINIHHNKVDSTGSEGMYIGYTNPSVGCNGTDRFPHFLRNVRVWENEVSNTGNDGIQPSLCDSALAVFNNRLTNIGLRDVGMHNEGIIVGQLSNGEVYGNTVTKCRGTGILFLGRNIKVYNNVIEATDGSYFNDRGTTGTGSYQVYNNTFIRLSDPNFTAIYIDKTGTAQLVNTFVRNNLIIYKMPGNPIGVSGLAAPSGVVVANNLIYRNFAQAMLVDSVGNYAPRAGSPAIDAGAAIAGLTTDLASVPRPQGANFDVGAYEFRSAATNLPPVVSAGNARTVNLPLPQGGVVLAGTASDPDGSIASVRWEQVSGPSQAQLANANTLNLTILQAVRGAYVFRLTATDNRGASSSAQVTINFNQPPVIAPFSGGTLTLPTTSTEFALRISDIDGSVATIACEQVFGPVTATIAGGTTANPRLSGLTVPGIYRFAIRSTDNLGAVGSRVVSVQVNRALEMMIWGPSAIMLPTTQVALVGMANSPDARIQSLAWSQVSGPSQAQLANATTLNLTTRALVQGTYVFRLRATDTNGASATRDFTLAVVPSFAVSGLQLVNNGTALAPLANGATIDYSQLGVVNISLLNIRAQVTGAVASMRFVLNDGTRNLVVASDNTAPFTLYGGAANTVWALAPGSYRLTATPYSGANLSGAEGVPVTINFTVVNNAGNVVGNRAAPAAPAGNLSTNAAPAAEAEATAAKETNQAPVPDPSGIRLEGLEHNVKEKLERYLGQGAVVSVRDASGRELLRASGSGDRASLTLLFEQMIVPQAVYVYTVVVPGENQAIMGRFVVQK